MVKTRRRLDNHHCHCALDRKPRRSHLTHNRLFRHHMAHPHHPILKGNRGITDHLPLRQVNRPSLLVSRNRQCPHIPARRHHRTNGANHHPHNNMASNHTSNKISGGNRNSRNMANLHSSTDSNHTANMFVALSVTHNRACNYVPF